jgi:hypothetical protein
LENNRGSVTNHDLSIPFVAFLHALLAPNRRTYIPWTYTFLLLVLCVPHFRAGQQREPSHPGFRKSKKLTWQTELWNNLLRGVKQRSILEQLYQDPDLSALGFRHRPRRVQYLGDTNESGISSISLMNDSMASGQTSFSVVRAYSGLL